MLRTFDRRLSRFSTPRFVPEITRGRGVNVYLPQRGAFGRIPSGVQLLHLAFNVTVVISVACCPLFAFTLLHALSYPTSPSSKTFVVFGNFLNPSQRADFVLFSLVSADLLSDRRAVKTCRRLSVDHRQVCSHRREYNVIILSSLFFKI